MEGMNAQTAVLLAVIIVGMVFAARRMYRVFSLKDDCCGGGAKDSSKKFKAVRVSDTNEEEWRKEKEKDWWKASTSYEDSWSSDTCVRP